MTTPPSNSSWCVSKGNCPTLSLNGVNVGLIFSDKIFTGAVRTTYSTTDMSDPLNAEIDDAIYIDTKDLCKRIAYELKQHSIPQAVFAERILCR